MTRLEIYENQLKVCEKIDVYPRMLSPKDLSRITGMSVPTIRGMINKMTNKYLLSEELICGETYYFFSFTEDKRKTLRFIDERIEFAKEVK